VAKPRCLKAFVTEKPSNSSKNTMSSPQELHFRYDIYVEAYRTDQYRGRGASHGQRSSSRCLDTQPSSDSTSTEVRQGPAAVPEDY
jgi:hypothetical protein